MKYITDAELFKICVNGYVIFLTTMVEDLYVLVLSTTVHSL